MNNVSMKFICAIALSLMMSGCGTTHKLKSAQFTEEYKMADYCKAADTVFDEKGVCSMDADDFDPDDYNIDEQLNGGTSLFLAKKTELTGKIFEQASHQIQEDLDSTGIMRGAVEIVGNASAVDYNPMIMDSVYLHSYTILNALSQENKEEARIQVNRAQNAQTKAVQEFKKEIAKQNEENSTSLNQIAKEAKEANKKNIDSVMSNYKEFARWNGYKDFVNPYVTYMSALYFMTNGSSKSDYEDASNYMKRVSGMIRNNSYVKKDLALANSLASGKKKEIEPTVWVIFENGLVANFEEFRLDLPRFIATNNVKTASIALPYPKQREAAFANISVSNGKSQARTELLADIDNIFISEFKKKLPVIVTKAVTKLTLQTVAQAVAQNKFGDLGGITMSVYSVATAGADTRSWYSLPKNVQLAKIAKNGSELSLNIGGQNYKVEVPAEGNSLIYVRVPVASSTPTINVVKL